VAKRRGDNPLSVLVLGILSICAFGVMFVWVNDTRPILKLRSVLLKEYGGAPWTTRFVPPSGFAPSYIQVLVPDAHADRRKRLEIGLFALPEYISLAEGQTRVARVEVMTSAQDVPAVVVDRGLVGAVDRARLRTGNMTQSLTALGLHQARVTVVGHSFTGVDLRVEARGRSSADASALCARAIKTLEANPLVGRCEVTIRVGKDNVATRVGGRDVPKAPPKPAPEAPPTKPEPKAPSNPEPASKQPPPAGKAPGEGAQ
jgi:hypothetical protein